MEFVLIGATASTFGFGLPQLAIYIIPSIIAIIRRPVRWKMAVAINLILGWTVVGWIVAMVLAFGRSENGLDNTTIKSQARAIEDAVSTNHPGVNQSIAPQELEVAIRPQAEFPSAPAGSVTLWFRNAAESKKLDRSYDWYLRDVAQLQWTDNSDFSGGFMNDMAVALILMIKIGDALYRPPSAASDIPTAYGAAFVFSAICQEATFGRLTASVGAADEVQMIGLVLQKMAVGIAVIGSDRERAELLVGGRHPLLNDGPCLVEVMRLAATPELQASARAVWQSNP